MSIHREIAFPNGQRSVAREAKAFVIWREGRSVNWKCTVPELAEATGVCERTVRHICAERGWPVQSAERGERSEPADVAYLITAKAARRHPRKSPTEDPLRTLQRIIEDTSGDAEETVFETDE